MRLSPRASQVLAGLIKAVAGVREERKIWSLTLEALSSFFEATSGAVFLYKRSHHSLRLEKSLHGRETWAGETLLDFYHNRKPELAGNTLMAPVRAGRRVIGVLALGREDPFDEGAGREATEMLKTIGHWAGCRRALATHAAECGIAKAVIRGVTPKDVIYRILHHLRRFIDYDHGATVTGFADETTGRVLARQVAWSKGRSDLIGRTFPVVWNDLPSRRDPAILSSGTARLWDSLGGLREEGSPEKGSIMTGPLAEGGTLLGLVEVSGTSPDFFADDDAGILSGFMPYLAWCVKNLHKSPEGHHG